MTQLGSESKKPECFGVRPFYATAEKCNACPSNVPCRLEHLEKQVAQVESKQANTQYFIACIVFLILINIIIGILI